MNVVCEFVYVQRRKLILYAAHVILILFWRSWTRLSICCRPICCCVCVWVCVCVVCVCLLCVCLGGVCCVCVCGVYVCVWMFCVCVDVLCVCVVCGCGCGCVCGYFVFICVWCVWCVWVCVCVCVCCVSVCVCVCVCVVCYDVLCSWHDTLHLENNFSALVATCYMQRNVCSRSTFFPNLIPRDLSWHFFFRSFAQLLTSSLLWRMVGNSCKMRLVMTEERRVFYAVTNYIFFSHTLIDTCQFWVVH